jgi:hypothetical protein
MLADSQHVLTLRDRDSVAELARRLPAARRVVLVGNGGIALELAHALRGVEVRPCPQPRLALVFLHALQGVHAVAPAYHVAS